MDLDQCKRESGVGDLRSKTPTKRFASLCARASSVDAPFADWRLVLRNRYLNWTTTFSALPFLYLCSVFAIDSNKRQLLPRKRHSRVYLLTRRAAASHPLIRLQSSYEQSPLLQLTCLRLLQHGCDSHCSSRRHVCLLGAIIIIITTAVVAVWKL
jgi:hypothetical protein